MILPHICSILFNVTNNETLIYTANNQKYEYVNCIYIYLNIHVNTCLVGTFMVFRYVPIVIGSDGRYTQQNTEMLTNKNQVV